MTILLNNTGNPISRDERNKINENWQRIIDGLTNLQMQIKVLAGGQEVDELIVRLEKAIESAETDLQNYIEQINSTVQDAVDKNNTATQQAIDKNNTALQASLGEVSDKLQDLSTAITNAETATLDTTNAKNSAIQATQDAQNAISNMQSVIDNTVHRGEWNSETQYFKNNMAVYNGSTFISLQDNLNKVPPTLPTQSNTYWSLFAEKGDKGSKGDKGDTGAALSILGKLTDTSQLPPTGQAGQAYTVNGELYVWSENLDSWENVGNIKGEKGDTGATGEDGKSAYEVAVVNGFVGTSEEWLASLKGDKGQDADLTEVNQNISNLQLSSTKNQTDNLQRAINVKLPPTPLVAATGDGIVNDQPSIQAIIDYANLNNYDIYIPNGVYRLNDTLKRKGSVSIYGQNMMLTNLKFYKASGGTVIDTVNEPLHGVTMQGFKISKDTAVGGTTGILGGSTLQKYNSAIGQFKNIMIEGLTCGIAGNGEPSGVGIFDCLFENIFINNCFVGIRFDGSGNILKNARIVHCGTGISFEHLNTESFAGINVIGGVFVQNSFDIGIPNVEGIRPCSFNGTWFEQASNGLINIPNADTKLMSLSFRDCMLSINGTFPLLNFYNAIGAIKIDTCTIAQVNNSSVLITPPNNVESILKVSNSIQILNDGSRSILNYSKNENWLPLTLQNNWKNAFESSITKYFKTDDNVVHLQIAMRDGDVGVGTVVANLPEKFRPKQSVRFSIFDGTNNVPRHLYITSGGDVVIQTVANVTLVTGIWSGYVTFKADK